MVLGSGSQAGAPGEAGRGPFVQLMLHLEGPGEGVAEKRPAVSGMSGSVQDGCP